MNVDLAREFYYRELDGKAQLDARLGMYTVPFTAVGGVIIYLTRSALTSTGLSFFVSISASALSLLVYFVALIWLVRATIGFTYKRLPYSNTLKERWETLSNYHWKYPWVFGSAARDFEEELIEHFSTDATINASHNSVRAARYSIVGNLLLWVFVLSAISGVAQAIPHVLPILHVKGI
jgi:hypothetical protein